MQTNAARHGRTLPDLPFCVYTTVRIDDNIQKARQETQEFLATYYGGGVHMRGLMGLGPADAVTTALQQYAAAGVTDLCIRFAGTDQIDQLERFTKEVLPTLL
jgi:alkanesulfonate monooxygenase SsuD/methylene tetrahydromethanopterin reductase-like flavin-dependent oxidoreductase (luciferase family)